MRHLLYLITFAFIISCSSNNENNTYPVDDEPTSIENITFSDEQIKLAGIVTGKIEKRRISETIECSGIINAAPENIATISPIIGGFIKKLNFYPGNYVKKGAVLANLQHPDFIILQQQYTEAKSQADYFKEEFKRQGELTVENAASIKKMQKAKSDYLSSEAIYKSLKAQLELLGVNPESVEKGDFVKEFFLYSTISGTVSQLSSNIGKYISPENSLYEIIDDRSLNILLNVYEKDIKNINLGQNIKFWSLNDKNEFEAKVNRVGIKINNINNTFTVAGTIENLDKILKHGMHINASINISERETFTIPNEALINYNDKDYVFTKKEGVFSLVEVKKGIEQNTFIEITNFNSNLIESEIVVKGTYFLLSKLEAE